MVGSPPTLSSKFGVTYSMLLNLARHEQMSFSMMLARSFLTHRARTTALNLSRLSNQLKAERDALPLPSLGAKVGDGCDQFGSYYDLLTERASLCGELLKAAARMTVMAEGAMDSEPQRIGRVPRGDRAPSAAEARALKVLLPPGRVLVLRGHVIGGTSASARPRLAVLLGAPQPTLSSCVSGASTSANPGGSPATSAVQMPLRCLVASQQSGATPHPLTTASFAPAMPASSDGPEVTVEEVASGSIGELRWNVLTVHPCHVLHICKARESVGNGAMSTPPVEAALKGVANSLCLLQRKHRFEAMAMLDVAAELRELAAAVHTSNEGSGEMSLGKVIERHVVLDASLAGHVCTRLANLPALCNAEDRRRWLESRIVDLDAATVSSSDLLTLVPEASKRQRLLRELGYLHAAGVRSGDAGSNAVVVPAGAPPSERSASALTLKGRVACELKTTVDELVLTETICTGLLHTLSPAEAAGFLSLFVSKGKVSRKPTLPPKLTEAKDELMALASRMATLQVDAGVLESGGDEYVHFVLNEAMIEAAYHWADGASFAELKQHTSVAEGDIVRILSRVEELAKEVRSAARLLGDALLGRKLDAVLVAIKRDVVAAPSLYTDMVGLL